MTDKLILTEQERTSALWIKLKTHYENRLHTLRTMNDTEKPEIKTAHLRGKISQVKEFLALDNPAPEPVANDQ